MDLQQIRELLVRLELQFNGHQHEAIRDTIKELWIVVLNIEDDDRKHKEREKEINAEWIKELEAMCKLYEDSLVTREQLMREFGVTKEIEVPYVCFDKKCEKEEEVCTWTKRYDRLGYADISTMCGWGGLDTLLPNWNFCPYCGKKLVVVIPVTEDKEV
jgi:hypothetical protein